jgi:type IX secretion system PorP/SprF family membrane protein
MGRINYIVAGLLLLLSAVCMAQQDALFTQYMYNKLEYNPAYAGSRDALSMDLLSRFQWIGIEGAPRSFSFTVHTPLPNPHIGLGLYAYHDAIGPSVDYNLMGTFAYRIIFPTTHLCFGLSAGIKYYDIDWNLLDPKNSGDPSLNNQVHNKVVPDVDFGIYYYGPQFYLGLSSKHLLQNQIVVSSAPPEGGSNYTKLLRNYYMLLGGAFPLGEKLQFLPSLLVKYVKDAPVQIDMNVRFLFYDLITLGASYRTENAMALMVGVNITKGLSVGYSYDIWFNSLRSYNSGSHEIRIGYDIDLINRSRMLTPRFF